MKKIITVLFCLIFLKFTLSAQRKTDMYFFSGYSYGYKGDHDDSKKIFWRIRRSFSLNAGLRWYNKKSKWFYEAGLGIAGAQESYFAAKSVFLYSEDLRTIMPSLFTYGQLQVLSMYPLTLKKSSRLDSRIILGAGLQLSFDLSNTTSESNEYNGNEIISTSYAIDAVNTGIGYTPADRAPIPVIIGYAALQITPAILKKKYFDFELFIRPSLYAGNKISYEMTTPIAQISGTGKYKLSAFGIKLIGRLHTNEWFKK